MKTPKYHLKKLTDEIRKKMRSDILEINGFTLEETKKWPDRKLVEYYLSSMENSLFLDNSKKAFPKHFKPEGQQRADQMEKVLGGLI